ncbi:MAG: GntR family transcriptional regulator [Polyangiaceae bacterium]|nr:GntR family transcriptional regulator [Polyangiaceae bacterium]
MLTIEVDFGSARPVYRQIAEQVRGLIARGDLSDGAELPSVRQLAANVGVNLNTVAKAYRILADEGLVDLRHGSRARVVGGARARAPEVEGPERELGDVISRLVLQGRGREEVSAFFETALERFFER